jgi:pentatricopeptide repeat protein
MPKSLENRAYEGAVQQDCEASLSGAAAADRLLDDIQAICLGNLHLMSKQGMVDESIALYEEMYNRICEERMGLQILCSRHCLELGGC